MNTPAQSLVKKIRPPFKLVNPIAAAITLIYGTGDILLGFGLITYKVQLKHLLTVNNITTYPVWGVIFALFGLAMLISYKRNEWIWMKYLHLAGLLIKSFWMVGLIARYITGDQQNTIVPSIWLMLLFTQVVIYIYFIPPPILKEPSNGRSS